ncbi:MAG TPA: aminoglycoside 6-adenylyltransferase, partial [Ardenticatenaceae bacterium]
MNFEQKVLSWAERRPDVRAILVVGSGARRHHPADEWSDLDLEIFTTDSDPYLTGVPDIEEIGLVLVSIPFDKGDGYPEHLVLFEGVKKVDFAFSPIEKLRRLTYEQPLDELYERGYYVLLDKDGLAAQMPAPTFAAPPLVRPTEEAFIEAVNAFWYHAHQIAKLIRRRDLWNVKTWDALLKEHLLQVMEWHARATRGWEHDTWHSGRFLPEWADAETWAALQHSFAHFDAEDSWRAL